MLKKSCLTSYSIFLLISPALLAQITLDGTLGRSGPLPGPNYQIGADLGQQHGGNLFHSFRDFNLQNHESATFVGPETVKNVISRVTSGNPSSIDGTLRSTIPHADMYFLNPAGILFGKNAKLEVQGGFHASTADTLRLGTNGQFNARQPSQSVLTVAPPSAFGFLTDSPAPIAVQDSTLSVPKGQTLSLVGGDLQITAAQFRFNFHQPPVPEPQLSAESGRINLASVAARGEISPPTPSNLTLNTAVPGGKIQLHNSWINVGGEGSGNIYIHGGRFELEDSVINSDNKNDQGGTINIEADALRLRGLQMFSGIYANTWGSGQGGTIRLLTKQLSLSGGAQIVSATFGTGEGGSVLIKADELTVSGKLIKQFKELGYPGKFPKETAAGYPSGIFGNSFRTDDHGGKAGLISIEVRQLTLSDGGEIANGTFGTGDGGIISIKADTVTISGIDKEQSDNSGILGDSFNSDAPQTGHAGDILIEARQITLSDQALLESSTLGQGNSSAIRLQVTEALTMQHGFILSQSLKPTGAAGNAGAIKIEARHMTLTDQSAIANDTKGSGQAGTIVLKVGETLTLQNSVITNDSESQAESAGNAGHIKIEARQMNLNQSVITSDTGGGGAGGTITIQVAGALTVQNSAIFSNSFSEQSPAGKAGQIEITAPQVNLKDYAAISSSTFGPGQGGTIKITGVDTLTLLSGFILSDSASETIDAGNAGEITIQANQIYLSGNREPPPTNQELSEDITNKVPTLLHLRPGQIATLTNKAAGGNITITISNLLYLYEGQITTSAHGGKGNGGNITVDNPTFVILNKGEIKAEAEAGRGGNIFLASAQFLTSSDSKVSASSRLGIDGRIVIKAPNETISGSLQALSSNLLKSIATLKRNPCGAKSLEEIEHPKFKLYVFPLAGSQQSPNDWQPSPLLSLHAGPSTKDQSRMKVRQSSEGEQTKVKQVYKPALVVMECEKGEKTIKDKKEVMLEQLF